VAIGHALGARVVAIDVDPEALILARRLGADVVLEASIPDDVTDALHALGGAHVSVDCLGGSSVASTSIRSLRPLGRHVQIGLFPSASADLPISLVVRDELEVLGVHGQSASRFGPLFEMLGDGLLDLAPLVTARISLDDVPAALPAMGDADRRLAGVAVVTRF
jgi:alcohol dehydrogenase